MELLSSLVHVYDAYVYHAALTLFRTVDCDEDIQTALDAVYHALMEVEEKYKEWWKDVKELGDLYTKPTIRRILNTPTVMQQLVEYEDIETAAEAAIRDPDGPGLQPVTRQVIEALNANARRRQLQRTTIQRELRREQTV